MPSFSWKVVMEDKPVKHTKGACKGSGILSFKENGSEFNELFGIQIPVITLECSRCGELPIEEMPSGKLLNGFDDLEEI